MLYFRTAKALLAMGYAERPLGWTVVTQQTEALSPAEVSDPTHAGFHGLAGNMAREHANWPLRLVDLPVGSLWPLDALLALPLEATGAVWFYRAGQWYQKQLLTLQPPATDSSRYQRGGMQVELDDHIPPALYRAVAELLAWLYHIEAARTGGGKV